MRFRNRTQKAAALDLPQFPAHPSHL